MAASCYICATSASGAIPGRQTGDALGVCDFCSVLACYGHGSRDPNAPRWECVLCTPSLLLASGAAHQTNGAMVYLPAAFRSVTLYPSLRVFLEVRPDFAPLLQDISNHIEHVAERLDAPQVAQLWNSVTDEGRRLVTAAWLLAAELEIPPDYFVGTMRLLCELWARR